MTSLTTPDNLVIWTVSDPDALSTASAAMQNSVQAALTNSSNVRQIKTYKWTNAAARNAQTGMGEGDIGDQSDTDTRYRYDGSTWNVVWAPFAMASGFVTGVTSTADTVVTLPAGRFTVAPGILLGPSYVTASGASGTVVSIAYPPPTTTDFRLRSASTSGVGVYWMALQMTPTSAGG